MAPHVVICDAKSPAADGLEANILAEYDIEASYETASTEADAVNAIGNADGVMLDSNVPVTEDVLRELPNLKVVARAGIGVDNVDIDAAHELGMTVLHHPTYCIDEVATHALGLALSAVRKLPMLEHDARTRAGIVGDSESIHRFASSTVGIVGFGKIGRRFATILTGFGCDVLAHDPYVDPNVIAAYNVEPVSFETLLEQSHVLSLHVPLTPTTEGMIDADALSRMREDAVLINTARGPVIDTDALVDAVEDGSIGYACLDVTAPEPLPEDHALFDLENVIITPHMAWYSDESRAQLRAEVARDVGRTLRGERPANPVTPDMPWV